MPGKPSSALRARRLLALLPLLRPAGAIGLHDLASATGTDPETVAADLALLSLCGADQADPAALVPVLVEGSRAVTFGDLPAMGAPVRLTGAEAGALIAALEACGVDPSGALGRRLAAVTAGSLDTGALARRVRAAATPGGLAHVHAQLTAATAGRRVTRISYAQTGAALAEERTVRPWDLFMWRGHWYLRAWDEGREAERTFRLDRVSSVEITGVAFEPPARLERPTDAAPDMTGLPRAEVVFAKNAADLNERDWPGATFTPAGEGGVRASVPYAGTAWLARQVAARGGDAVVVGPDELRDAVAALAREEIAGL